MTKKNEKAGLAYLGGGSLHGVPARDLSAEEVERCGIAYRNELVRSAEAALEDYIHQTAEPDEKALKTLKGEVRNRKRLTLVEALERSGLYGLKSVAASDVELEDEEEPIVEKSSEAAAPPEEVGDE